MDSWGPPFWFVLHTSAEQLGKPHPKIIEVDELNRWILLLKSVEGALPCAMCRDHYHKWLIMNPLTVFQGLRGTALREAARIWIWKLHEDVNVRRGVASGLTVEMLPELYSNLATYQIKIEELIKVLREKVQQGLVKAEATFTFRKHLHYLRKLTDSI
jgi:hypothetical protein